MPLKNDRYTYRVTWSEDDNEYVGLCAEFPSLSWLSSTPESALKGIRRLVADIVKDIQSNDETVPEPIACRRYPRSGLYTHRPVITANLAAMEYNNLLDTYESNPRFARLTFAGQNNA